MTTPKLENTANADAPVAEVKVGLSEILGIIALASSLLTALFGHDFGVAKNAQALAALGVVLIPMAISLARSIKHHGAAHANAAVYIAQLNAVSQALQTPEAEHNPTALAAGVTALNVGTVAAQVDTEDVSLDDIPQDLPPE